METGSEAATYAQLWTKKRCMLLKRLVSIKKKKKFPAIEIVLTQSEKLRKHWKKNRFITTIFKCIQFPLRLKQWKPSVSSCKMTLFPPRGVFVTLALLDAHPIHAPFILFRYMMNSMLSPPPPDTGDRTWWAHTRQNHSMSTFLCAIPMHLWLA